MWQLLETESRLQNLNSKKNSFRSKNLLSHVRSHHKILEMHEPVRILGLSNNAAGCKSIEIYTNALCELHLKNV